MKRMLIVFTCLGLLLCAPSATADEWNKRTRLTVNEPIAVPGKILQPGEYVMKLMDSPSDRHIVQIYRGDEQKLVTTVLAIPNSRMEATGETAFGYWETPAGQPRALRAWFYPGDTHGQEFAYPKDMALMIARSARQNVPAVVSDGADLLSAEVREVTPSGEEREYANRSNGSKADAKAIIRSGHENARRFEDRFEIALDASSLDGSDVEDRMNQWADYIEDELEAMRDEYRDTDDRNEVRTATGHLENALIAAAGINRVMIGKDFSLLAESHWSSLRSDLNRLARQWHRPVLPDAKVAVVTNAPVKFADRAEVRQAIAEIEDSIDRFRNKFEETIRYYSTASLTERADDFVRWSNELERATDRMREEYNEKDAREFGQRLTHSLALGESINRIMLRSELSRAAQVEWGNVRTILNRLAAAFDRPILDDTISVARANPR